MSFHDPKQHRLHERLLAISSILIVIAASLFIFMSSALGQDAPTPERLHPPFKKLWEARISEQLDDIVIADGVVFYGTWSSYGAVDLATGKHLWTKTFSEDCFGTEVASDGKNLFVAVGLRKVMACDPETGEELWSQPTEEYAGPMTVTEGVLLCGLETEALSALDTKTGRPVWKCSLSSVKKLSRRTQPVLSTDPLVTDDRLFVGTYTGDVFCIDPKSGTLRWRYTTGQLDEQHGIAGLVVDSARLYLVTPNGELDAVDVNTGERAWSYGPGERPVGGLALMDDLVLLVSMDGTLRAVGAADGKERWQQTLTRESEPRLSSPAAVDGQVLLCNESFVQSFDVSGKELWKWDSEETWFYSAVRTLSNGIVLQDARYIYRFVMGEPPKLPTDPAQRQTLAQELAARFDELTKDERRTLGKLGNEAVAVLVPIVRNLIDAYESIDPTDDASYDASYKASSRIRGAVSVLVNAARKENTSEMVAIVRDAQPSFGISSIFDWMLSTGDEELTIPFFLDILRGAKDEKEYIQRSEVAIEAVGRSSDPRAVAFLIEQLADQGADRCIRGAAFVNLARTGGEAGLKAVLAAKDTNRTIPAIAEVMQLAKLGAQVRTEEDEYIPDVANAELVNTRSDKDGVFWGLIESSVLGSGDDLWIAKHDGKQWGTLLYTGMTQDQLGSSDWFEKFVGNDALTKDTDDDGWTDLVETRLVTDPAKQDTDGDGLPDSKDRNPLAAPRDLDDIEQVLAAAYEARYRFSDEGQVPSLVALPEGVKSFELSGWNWVIVPRQAGPSSSLDKLVGEGVAGVIFTLPNSNFTGGALRRTGKETEVILWNDDRTEAKLELETYYGPLAATGYEILLKKFGDRWVVIEMKMTWIS